MFLAGAAASLPASLRAQSSVQRRRPRCILLRGSWQSINIGDIGHTPGAIEMIRAGLPDARIILWAGGVEHGAKELIQRRFPEVQIITPATGADGRLLHASTMLNRDGRPTLPELEKAWEDADIMIHGSGSDFGARGQLAAFHRATGKPCGVFGTSVDPLSGFGPGRDPEGGTLKELWRRMERLPGDNLDEESRWIMDRSAFFFTRETLSREYLRHQGVRTPVLEFGPDTQFAMTLRDDVRGDAYRAAHGLEERRFLCIIPRLRYTPYHRILNRPPTSTDEAREAISERSAEADHAKLRELITRYVRATGHRVMTCPEMTYQIDVAKRWVVDPLPEDVKKHVVWRDTYWLPDEAASIYARAQAVVSLDCHSPIIAVANGTPGFYVRQPTDTCKGQMYPDLGLGDWMSEVDEIDGAELWRRLAAALNNRAESRVRCDGTMARVREAQARMISALNQAVA